LLKSTALLSCLLAIALAPSNASSEDPLSPEAAVSSPGLAPSSQIGPGDLAVTGFSGTKLGIDGLAPGVDPVEKTIIDPAGASVRIYDLTTLTGPPAGQVLTPAVKLEVKAQDIGQVFGLAIDDSNPASPPNLFAAATSAFGLQIVAGSADKDGSALRLKAGAPGAHFMAGQFGGLPGAGPGSIFKIDGTSKAVTVFASTDNTGPGLAGLAIDPKSRSLYAADLDTGLISRFALDTGGASTGLFDHGVTALTAAGKPAIADDGKKLDTGSADFKPSEPATWGLTQPARRVTGLAVRDGRLFYAVAEGPEIWSVRLNADGGFASDARLETAVKTDKPSAVTSIVFDAQGRMLIGVRGETKSPFDFGKFVEPDSGRVLRFAPNASAAAGAEKWSADVQEFSVGAAAGNNAGSGGVALGHAYGADGSIDFSQCNATLATTGDTLVEPFSDERVVHGVQVNSAELARPTNTPPTQSVFVDFDGRLGNKQERGHVGAALAVQNCAAPPPIEGEPPIAGGPPVDSGGGGGGGAPGEAGAPPAGGEQPPVAEEQAPVDPNAPNLAVSKSRSCSENGDKLDCTFTIKAKNTGTTPIDVSGGSMDDVLNLPADAPVRASGVGDGTTATENGLHVTFPAGTIVPPGNETAGLTVKATFTVPKGGMVVENCAAISMPSSGAAAGNGAPTSGGANAPLAAEAGTAPTGPSVVVNNDGKGRCTPDPNDKNSQNCTFDVQFLNDSDQEAKNVVLQATPSDNGKITSAGSNAGVDSDTGTIKIGGFAAHDGRTFQVQGTFPTGTTPTLNLSLTGDAAAAAQAAGAAAQAAAPAGAGGNDQTADAGFPPPDGNPADDVACVKFDTNNPNAPEQQTNEPTEPGPGDQSGDGTVAPDKQSKPDVAVSKTGTCTPNGDKADCSFSISLTNNGTAPVTLGSTSTLEDVFDGAKPQISNLAPGAVTTPTGFTVPLNETTLQPGETLPPLTVNATVDIPPEGATVQNCATLNLGPSPVPIDDVQVTHGNHTIPANSQQAIVAVQGDPVCIKRGGVKDCTFQVSVRNFGKNPFPLKLKFKTDSTNPNDKFAAPPGFIDPNQNSQGGGFVLLSKNPPDQLASGDEATFSVRTEVPVDASPLTATVETFAENGGDPRSATSDSKAGTEPAQDAPAFDDADPTNNTKVCAPPVDLKRGTPPPKPQAKLSIKKSAKGDKCQKSGTTSFTCPFEITITNNGPDEFNDKVVLDDETTNLDATSTMDGGFQCDPTGTRGANCSIASLQLKPGESKTFTATSVVLRSTVDAANLAPGGCILTNGVSINSPRSDDAKAQTATATAKLGNEVNHGGKVACDPPGLKLAKTAQGCTPAGDGFDCKYHLTITSTGPDPFDDGTIVVNENLPGGASLKNPPQGCGGAGGGTQCKFEHVSLAVGAARELDLVTSVPKSAVAPGKCEIKNDASVSIPGADVSGMSELHASASAKIDSPECNNPSSACQGGMTLTKGVCSCPAGQEYNTSRKSCISAPAATCPSGYVGEYPTCCPPPQKYDVASHSCQSSTAACFGGMVLIATKGTCGCPAGTTFDTRRSSCLGAPPTVCLVGYSGIYPVCCSPAQYYRDGRCYTREVYQPPITLPRGGTNGVFPEANTKTSRPTTSTGGTTSPPPVRCADGSQVKSLSLCSPLTFAPSVKSGGTNGVNPSPFGKTGGTNGVKPTSPAPPTARCANESLVKGINTCPQSSGGTKTTTSLPVRCPNGFYAKSLSACGPSNSNTKTFTFNRPNGGAAKGKDPIKSVNPILRSANPNLKSANPNLFKSNNKPIKAIGKLKRPAPPANNKYQAIRRAKRNNSNNTINYGSSGNNKKFVQPH
jgi:hypothetical protein